MINSKQGNNTGCHLTTPILYTRELSLGYQHKQGTLLLEEGLNIQIRNGELVCLIGPNGCGKSTLMRTIAGLQKPLHGKTFISDVNLKKLAPHKYAKLLSLVLTDKINAGSLTVHDIVAIGRYPYINRFAKLNKVDHQIIDESLAKVHLEDYTHRFYNELSDGEKQRVLIAKALAQDTPLIMLDEPTAHLDLPNRVEIMNILKRLAKETCKAILLSTHELDLALQTADTIWLMNRQNPLKTGTPEDLVLNGAFEDVFHGNAFDFDKTTGSFRVVHHGKGEVYLEANELHYIWTKRALEREGYKVSHKKQTPIQVFFKNDIWEVNIFGITLKSKSIDTVLSHLRHSEYYESQKIISNTPSLDNHKIKALIS
ncbi:ABC transporter ATP-binding protein [Labilibaculum euxinus]